MLLTFIFVYYLIRNTMTLEMEMKIDKTGPKEPLNHSPFPDPDDGYIGKSQMPEEPPLPHNWSDIMANTTSCEEFLANVTFDPFKVLDIDWKIWYFWNQEHEHSYEIKFSIPTKTLQWGSALDGLGNQISPADGAAVAGQRLSGSLELLIDRFRTELDDEMKPPVEWDDAILFMETSIDFSALFIKTEEDGKFRVIPSLAFEYTKLPTVVFAMKVVDPYLAMLNCKYRVCYALAPVNKMPYHETYEEEAKKIGFRGQFGHSHIEHTAVTHITDFEDDHLAGLHDDDQEDMHLEIQKQFNENMESTLL